ncbi:unnamed protein product [Rotaria magnacalcarata]|uniref:phosphatidylinositol-3,5-bisphosphate 3-phosphatase n=2 Tax=Rotaria magnacalcarata TaxID=392030 RepID=A0A814NTZ0_9BILA|nr:unnamed protein product [Rotaria magnacalcarata]CAF1458798.1 unnamed protein product [Rotaria magnacalcarata]
MSRDVHRDSMKKLSHSNSDDDLRRQTTAIRIHSKPTSHGAEDISYGVRDDGSSISSSNEYVPSSSYLNSSAALTGTTRGYLPDRQHVMAMSEQQTNIVHTYDLSLPIKLLPGEEDVKLKEDITYRAHNRPAPYRGELIVTKYRLMFVTKPPDSIQVLVDVPLGMISQIEKIGGQARSNINDGAAYGIEINCKDLRHFFFGNAKEQNQRRNLLDQLTRLVFPFSISKADNSNAFQFFNSFFALDYKRKFCINGLDEGWTLYNKMKDYTRMLTISKDGIQQNSDPHWTINAEINKNYALCDTYPDIIVLPSSFDSTRLQRVADFRSRNRIPVLSWYSRETYATITRSSQPLTGLANRTCDDDIELLRKIADANVNQGFKLVILDARPKVNAMANMANGGGYEDYPNCELEFHNIQNIHVMRESLRKLHAAVRNAAHEDKTWFSDLENSNWLFHIRAILTAAIRLVSLVHNEKRSVLVHCSDGWDRTAQLTSLAMLMLDAHYRTLNGYMILIEKEWISFGHKFFLRIGHGDKSDSERSPVFLQFLDCTFQLLQQFPSAFEFNEKLLITIADNLYSCQYGTFLLNSDKWRTDMKVSEHTMSAWTPILRERALYLNPFYAERSDNVLIPNNSSRHIKLWKNYYCRYMPGYRSTLDVLTQRYTTLLNLRKKFTDEINHIRQDGDQQPRLLSGTLYQSPMTTTSTNISAQSKSNVTQASATFMT